MSEKEKYQEELDDLLEKIEQPVKRIMTIDQIIEEYGDVLTEDQIKRLKQISAKK